MITLKELTWGNCFSYGENNSLRLDENTITQIIGVNGSGKSSIPLIIEEVLFSKNSKGVKKTDIANRNTPKDSYWIGLEFSKDENEYFLKVVRGATIKVTLIENGIDISSHTAPNTFKTVSDLLGMDFKTLSQLFYQNTNTSLQFLTATDTNRKKFLIDLLHLEGYVELFDIFKAAAKEVATVVTREETRVATIQKWLQQNKLEATDILPLQNLEISTDSDEIELGTLTATLNSISDKNRKIAINNDNRTRLSKIDPTEYQSIPASEIIDYDEDMAKLGAYKSQKSEIEKAIAKLEKLKDQCPTCEQDIDPQFKQDMLNQDKLTLSNINISIEELDAKISSIIKNNKDYTRKLKLQQEHEQALRSVDISLPTELLDKADLESRISELTKNIAKARLELKEVQEENTRRTKHNTRVQVISEQTESFLKDLTEATATLEVETAKLAQLETLKKAFSSNGLIAYKIENLVKELEELANSYLAELSDGRFTIEFVVSNDKLNVEVTDFGKSIDINMLSSGELARVNTATLLALRKLMNSMSKSKINVLFLDEVINVLDETGKEKLVEVLLNEDLNTFIVSHNWTHPLLAKIEIIKDEHGVSRIER